MMYARSLNARIVDWPSSIYGTSLIYAVDIYHISSEELCWAGAAEETRTPDPIITNDVLYQLSYGGTFLVWSLLWPYYSRVKPRKRLVSRIIPGRTR